MTEEEQQSKQPSAEADQIDNHTSESQTENTTTQDDPAQESSVEKLPEETEEKEEEPVELVEVPKTRLEELEQAEAKYMEDLKRERAEAINYRKRLQKQRDEFSEMASARVLSKILAVQDDLKRVLDNANGEIPESHLEGIQLVQQRLEGIFNQEGVTLIKVEEGKTKYDPKFMEAIVAQPLPDVPPNTVVGVVHQGFRKGDRVLRPAKVMISKKPDAPKEETPEQEEADATSSHDQPTSQEQTQEKTADSSPAQKDETGEN